jgi:predicted DCC family thiol-disulfide oxidoreductase YuxK
LVLAAQPRRAAFSGRTPLGQALYRRFGMGVANSDSMLLIQDGMLLTKGAAAISTARGLGRPFSLAVASGLVPRVVRDAIYQLVARNRFRLFGRRRSCWTPSAEIADRIL